MNSSILLGVLLILLNLTVSPACTLGSYTLKEFSEEVDQHLDEIKILSNEEFISIHRNKTCIIVKPEGSNISINAMGYDGGSIVSKKTSSFVLSYPAIPRYNLYVFVAKKGYKRKVIKLNKNHVNKVIYVSLEKQDLFEKKHPPSSPFGLRQIYSLYNNKDLFH